MLVRKPTILYYFKVANRGKSRLKPIRSEKML